MTFPMLVIYSRKKTMMQKYHILMVNILPRLIIINLRIVYLMQRYIIIWCKNKSYVSKFINNADLNEKIKILARKAELQSQQDKIKKLQTYESSQFIGRSFLFNDKSHKISTSFEHFLNASWSHRNNRSMKIKDC